MTFALCFKNQGLSPYLHVSSTMCNGFLRFTSGVTPADLMAAKLILTHIPAHVQDFCCLTVCDGTLALLAELCLLGFR